MTLTGEIRGDSGTYRVEGERGVWAALRTPKGGRITVVLNADGTFLISVGAAEGPLRPALEGNADDRTVGYRTSEG